MVGFQLNMFIYYKANFLSENRVDLGRCDEGEK